MKIHKYKILSREQIYKREEYQTLAGQKLPNHKNKYNLIYNYLNHII